MISVSKLLIISTKFSVLAVRLGSEYTSENSATEYTFSTYGAKYSRMDQV